MHISITNLLKCLSLSLCIFTITNFLILRNASVCSSLFGGYGEEVSCLQSINGFPLGPKIDKSITAKVYIAP